jgi:hypothetical protein
MAATDDIRLTNGLIEVTVSIAEGLRISRYAFVDGQNLLASAGRRSVPTPLGVWQPLGGHRLWVAPERMPGSYAPDALPVEHEARGTRSVVFTQPADGSGIGKCLAVSIGERDTLVTVTHSIVNRTCWPIRVAPWAISIVSSDATAIIPQPPFRSHAEDFLPARPMAQWSYTDFSDPRWSIGAKLIRLTPDPRRSTAQKIGVGNQLGWCAVQRGSCVYVKRFPWTPDAFYPDYGCNNELFTAGDYLEVETLGPLEILEPGAQAGHTERWGLFSDQPATESEAEQYGRLQTLAATIDMPAAA